MRSRISSLSGRNRLTILTVGGAIVVPALLWGLLVPFANLVGGTDARSLQGKDRVDALNGVRQQILITLGAVFAATGSIIAARTYSSNRRAQVSDRYATAISHIASTTLDERLGGIYSLGHIMHESPQDHEAIVDVLAAFIREHSWDYRTKHRYDPKDDTQDFESIDEGEVIHRVGAEIQAALTVLGGRPRRPERRRIDLSNSFLRDATFVHGNFDSAYFNNCNLTRASMASASLVGAEIYNSKAVMINFENSDMRDVRIGTSIMSGSRFSGANIKGITISGSSLRGSKFDSRADGVDFYNVDLRDVYFDASTQFPNVTVNGKESKITKSDAEFFVSCGGKIHPSVSIVED